MTAKHKHGIVMRTGSPSYRWFTDREVPKQSLPKDGRRDNRQFEKLFAYWQLSEYDLVPFGVMSFQHSLLYEGKRWWRSVNKEGGWAVVCGKKPSKASWLLETDVTEDPNNPWHSNVTKAQRWHCKGQRRRCKVSEDHWNSQIWCIRKPSHINQAKSQI
jgi:hypothetical protein